MISFSKWLAGVLHPSELQYKEKGMDDIRVAIQSQAVQELWLKDMVLKIQQANMTIDGLLDKTDKDRIWETVAVERRTLLRCMQMILDADDTIKSELEFQESQNRRNERLAQAIASTTAAPLDLRQSE